jgi:cytochrome b
VKPASGAVPVKLWDLPVRLIHWSFVALLPALWWTSHDGNMSTHKLLGYVLMGLIIFRAIWGIVGSETARFRDFIKGPRAVASYVSGLSKGEKAPGLGHNPLGGWSVVALLCLLASEAGFGLIAQDVDGIESGPLARYVSYDTADWARGWHSILFDALLVAIAVHIAAIVFYLVVKRDNLIAPMISGRKIISHTSIAPQSGSIKRAIIVLIISALFAYWVSLGIPY